MDLVELRSGDDSLLLFGCERVGGFLYTRGYTCETKLKSGRVFSSKDISVKLPEPLEPGIYLEPEFTPIWLEVKND